MPDNANPFQLFGTVFQQAIDAGIAEPNAMALATVGADGRPSIRIVLLKGFDERGFVFYTNLESRKGRELAGNPNAALCFFWQSLGKQVRVEGAVQPVPDAEADEYFATRPRGSQIGAWASIQSRELERREDLLARVRETEERYADAPVPRPSHWSGFRLAPTRIEFWTSGEFRLHDRQIFDAEPDGIWRRHVLYP